MKNKNSFKQKKFVHFRRWLSHSIDLYELILRSLWKMNVQGQLSIYIDIISISKQSQLYLLSIFDYTFIIYFLPSNHIGPRGDKGLQRLVPYLLELSYP